MLLRSHCRNTAQIRNCTIHTSQNTVYCENFWTTALTGCWNFSSSFIVTTTTSLHSQNPLLKPRPLWLCRPQYRLWSQSQCLQLHEDGGRKQAASRLDTAGKVSAPSLPPSPRHPVTRHWLHAWLQPAGIRSASVQPQQQKASQPAANCCTVRFFVEQLVKTWRLRWWKSISFVLIAKYKI